MLDAIELLRQRRGVDDLQFIVMGGGALREKFEQRAKERGLPLIFTGPLPYADMVPLLCSCDIAVNPIVNGSAASIINKVCDYAAAGLPVVNTQECPEYRELVDGYQMGINCENGNVQALADAIRLLAGDEALRKRMGANNRRLAEERFDRAEGFKKIIGLIEGE